MPFIESVSLNKIVYSQYTVSWYGQISHKNTLI